MSKKSDIVIGADGDAFTVISDQGGGERRDDALRPRVNAGTEVSSETARALSTDGLCEGCGAPLIGGRPQRRYCDGRCRARASRDRRARYVQPESARRNSAKPKGTSRLLDVATAEREYGISC